MERGVIRRMTFGERDRRTNYQRGADFERTVRDALYGEHGAKLVVRAAGSHGKADLVAFFEPEEGFVGRKGRTEDIMRAVPVAWLVQVKKDGLLPKAEREELIAIANETATEPYLAWHARRSGVKLMRLA
jgi:Holliday junction resolvase